MSFHVSLPTDNVSQDALTVTELTGQIKSLLEETFVSVSVCGEISDLARPRSGHIYFSLKDETAQIRAVLWRGTARQLKFDLDDGMEVICEGQIDVYPPRGSYQLVVREMEPRGVGALQLAFRQLHEKLSAEGLFDPGRKRPLPSFPQRVAVVTSPTGAAIRDFLQVLKRRWRAMNTLIVPSRVQGDGAADEIAAAIRQINHLNPLPDILVVTRGGGSLEDLWCFNEEAVVRAIVDSQVPVVSAIGHEIDITLSDLAADMRALTPSEAAEHVAPSSEDTLRHLVNHQQRLVTALRRRSSQARLELKGLASRSALKRPLEQVRQRARRVDELELRASRAIEQQRENTRHQITRLTGQLETLSPLGVLARGYSVTSLANGQLVHNSKSLSIGDQVVTRLAHGQFQSRVEEVD